LTNDETTVEQTNDTVHHCIINRNGRHAWLDLYISDSLASGSNLIIPFPSVVPQSVQLQSHHCAHRQPAAEHATQQPCPNASGIPSHPWRLRRCLCGVWRLRLHSPFDCLFVMWLLLWLMTGFRFLGAHRAARAEKAQWAAIAEEAR